MCFFTPTQLKVSKTLRLNCQSTILSYIQSSKALNPISIIYHQNFLMRNLFILVFASILISSCEKIPFPWNKPPTDKDPLTITDQNGKPVDEVHSGMIIQLSAPGFAQFSQQFMQGGKVMFDNKIAQLIGAQGDFIIVAVPIMNYPELRKLTISITWQLVNRRWIERLLYQPTVTGIEFAGYTEGAHDGTFTKPAEMTHDAAGNLYVIDQRATNDVIIKIDPAGITSVFAGAAGQFGRLVGIGINQTTGLVYVADATSQQIKSFNLTTPSTVTVLAGSGTAGNTDGTGTAASFRFGTQSVDDFTTNEKGQGLTLDAAGNIYVGERFGTGSFASQIRRVTPLGVTSVATGTRIEEPSSMDPIALPTGVTISPSNDLYYTSGASGFFQGITKITPTGLATRFAGKNSFEGLNDGVGAAAQFSYPKSLKFFGNFLYVADGTNGALRRIGMDQRVITLAGVGHFLTPTFCACPASVPTDGSYVLPGGLLAPGADAYETAARAIKMDQVGGVTVISPGLIYVSDYGYRCIWKITIM